MGPVPKTYQVVEFCKPKSGNYENRLLRALPAVGKQPNISENAFSDTDVFIFKNEIFIFKNENFIFKK